MKRPALGILGGSFDPVHEAHLRLARTARGALGLEKVLLIPAARNPLKAAPLTSPEHRKAMLELAVREGDGLEVCDVELRRSGPSYTVDTLRELHRERPSHRLWFLIGSDALVDLASWRDPEALLSLASFAVVPRGGARTRVRLSDLLPERFHTAYERDANGWRHRSGEELRALEFEPSEHSSSEIRARLRKGEPVTPWVAPVVLAYIRKHDLYREVE